MGTAEEVESALFRAWQVASTSERIVEDSTAFEDVLHAVVGAQGCVVPDLASRHGRRLAKMKGQGFCKNKPKARQRKTTIALPPIHPHCIRALAILKNQGEDLHPIAAAAAVAAEEEPLHSDTDEN